MTRLRLLLAAFVHRVVCAVRIGSENYQMVHVPHRCRSDGCTCPCGYCHHDRRHVPGAP